MITYFVTVRVDGPDDRTAHLAAQEVADHISMQYRHNTVQVSAGAPVRVRDFEKLQATAPAPKAETS